MGAVFCTPPPVIKQGDIVTTRTGRMARVVSGAEVPGERELVYLDDGEHVTLRTKHLTLIEPAPVVLWRKHTL